MKEKLEEIIGELVRILSPTEKEIKARMNSFLIREEDDARDALIVEGLQSYIEQLRRELLFL